MEGLISSISCVVANILIVPTRYDIFSQFVVLLQGVGVYFHEISLCHRILDYGYSIVFHIRFLTHSACQCDITK